jgi:hypothetical protein
MYARRIKNKKENGGVDNTPKVDPSATDNLIGFFALLLEIDRRVNPHLYKNQGQERYD